MAQHTALLDEITDGHIDETKGLFVAFASNVRGGDVFVSVDINGITAATTVGPKAIRALAAQLYKVAREAEDNGAE